MSDWQSMEYADSMEPASEATMGYAPRLTASTPEFYKWIGEYSGSHGMDIVYRHAKAGILSGGVIAAGALISCIQNPDLAIHPMWLKPNDDFSREILERDREQVRKRSVDLLRELVIADRVTMEQLAFYRQLITPRDKDKALY